MKILFTSVGRRVELIQAFRQAADFENIELTIIGTDITETAPALYFCDQVVSICRISDPGYILQLLRICREREIDCLIPTIDTDLLALSMAKGQFEAAGTKVLVSDPKKIKVCRDKKLTSDYFLSVGLKTPYVCASVEEYEQAFKDGKASFPAFIKPKDGSSSIDAYRADDLGILKTYAVKIKDYIIQPFISGREFTIDIFCDYDGNPVYITPRERLAVRAGEVMKTQIVQDKEMVQEMKKLVDNFKPCGQITVQLIREEKTGDDYYIEINPRFGGGAPLSIKAGADSASAILKMLLGKTLRYQGQAAKDGTVYSRYDQSICVNKAESVRV